MSNAGAAGQMFQNDKVARNTNVELQQRAVEYFNLGANATDEVLVWHAISAGGYLLGGNHVATPRATLSKRCWKRCLRIRSGSRRW